MGSTGARGRHLGGRPLRGRSHLLHLKYDRKHVAKGVRAHLTMGVAPDETHDGTDTRPSASASV